MTSDPAPVNQAGYAAPRPSAPPLLVIVTGKPRGAVHQMSAQTALRPSWRRRRRAAIMSE
jgi:hypothetical protein